MFSIWWTVFLALMQSDCGWSPEGKALDGSLVRLVGLVIRRKLGTGTIQND